VPPISPPSLFVFFHLTRSVPLPSLHQQNDRLAVALGVRFRLSTGFPNPLCGCVAVALLWDAGVLGRCGKVGVYFHLLERNRSEVADVKEFGLSKNATCLFRSIPSSPPTSPSRHFDLAPNGCHLGSPKSQDICPFVHVTVAPSLEPPLPLGSMALDVCPSVQCVSQLFTSHIVSL
jgi:hypothetical protein